MSLLWLYFGEGRCAESALRVLVVGVRVDRDPCILRLSTSWLGLGRKLYTAYRRVVNYTQKHLTFDEAEAL